MKKNCLGERTGVRVESFQQVRVVCGDTRTEPKKRREWGKKYNMGKNDEFGIYVDISVSRPSQAVDGKGMKENLACFRPFTLKLPPGGFFFSPNEEDKARSR